MVLFNKYLVNTDDTDDLVLKHQGIRSNSVDYAPMCIQLFKG